MLSGKIGHQSEARFMLEALRRGWELCKPFHHENSYDFLIKRPGQGKWETVQVKTASPRYVSSFVVDIRVPSSRQAYKDGDADLLFAVHPGGQCWMVPWNEILGRKKVTMRDNWRLEYV